MQWTVRDIQKDKYQQYMRCVKLKQHRDEHPLINSVLEIINRLQITAYPAIINIRIIKKVYFAF